MAMTNAERQAAYRARHLADMDGRGERLNLILDVHAKIALDRLAGCYGVTKRALLEHLILAAERATLDRATQYPGGAAEYYAGHLKLRLDALRGNGMEGGSETVQIALRGNSEIAGNGNEAGR